jgi:hypothetical protein
MCNNRVCPGLPCVQPLCRIFHTWVGYRHDLQCPEDSIAEHRPGLGVLTLLMERVLFGPVSVCVCVFVFGGTFACQSQKRACGGLKTHFLFKFGVPWALGGHSARKVSADIKFKNPFRSITNMCTCMHAYVYEQANACDISRISCCACQVSLICASMHSFVLHNLIAWFGTLNQLWASSAQQIWASQHGKRATLHSDGLSGICPLGCELVLLRILCIVLRPKPSCFGWPNMARTNLIGNLWAGARPCVHAAISIPR